MPSVQIKETALNSSVFLPTWQCRLNQSIDEIPIELAIVIVILPMQPAPDCARVDGPKEGWKLLVDEKGTFFHGMLMFLTSSLNWPRSKLD